MEQNDVKSFSRRNYTCCLSKVLHNSFYSNTVVHLAPYNVSTGEDRSVWYDSRISSLETNTHFISDESIQSKCEKKKSLFSHQGVCGSKSNDWFENSETTKMDFSTKQYHPHWVIFERIIKSYDLYTHYFNTGPCRQILRIKFN